MATITLQMTKSGYVKQESAGSVFPTNSSTWYSVFGESREGTEKLLYMGFSSYPSSIRHKALKNATFTVYANIVAEVYGCLYAIVCGSFNPSTLTYLNRPQNVADGLFSHSVDSSASGNLQLTISKAGATAKDKSLLAYNALNYKSFELTAYVGYLSRNSDALNVKTVLQNGSSAPYLTIEYDDSTTIISAVEFTTRLPASINNGAAQAVIWKYSKASGQDYYCADQTWAQTSAVFYWKTQNASTWNQIPISGNTTSLIIPANTFPTGSTIQYYLTGTDEEGTTSSTATYTATVPTTSVIPSNAPTSGYVNPRTDTSFGWYYGSTAGIVAAGSTTLHWRVSGDETWTDVQAASGATSVTVPANTFTVASTIEWYLSGTDATGYASESSVYSFSTAAGLVTTDPIYPRDSIESNNAPITLSWKYSSSDGFPPSRQKLIWRKITDNAWTTITNLYNGETSYTVPAETFPVGEIRWGVYPYNIDDVAGDYNIVSFICYGAPDAPVVYASENPFITVEWQSVGQQSYEIKIGDKYYGPYFGSEKSFSAPDYFEDGEYTVGVRIVGEYGLWSEWGVSVVSIQNTPGEDLVLSGAVGANTNNQLSWSTEEQTTDFFLYRDGVQIAHTNQLQFTDRFAAGGEHEYFVVNKLPDNNYTKSNVINLVTTVEISAISALNGNEWIAIKHSLKDQSDPVYNHTQQDFYNHLSGRTFPSVILSRYREMELTYSAVFLYNDKENQKKFERLFGTEVVMKVKDGTVFVGVLDSVSKTVRDRYYTSYAFTINRIEWEDYIDDTGDTL